MRQPSHHGKVWASALLEHTDNLLFDLKYFNSPLNLLIKNI